MPPGKPAYNLLVPTIIMGIMTVVLGYLAWKKGSGVHLTAMKSSLTMLIDILPLLVFALFLAGFVQVLIPKELLAKWVGSESGLRGIMIGSIAGGLAPGGPFTSMPIAAGLLKSGAGIGTMVSFMTGWSLWAVNRIPMEVGILGWKFTIARMACTLVFPPIAGLIAQQLFSSWKF